MNICMNVCVRFNIGKENYSMEIAFTLNFSTNDKIIHSAVSFSILQLIRERHQALTTRVSRFVKLQLTRFVSEVMLVFLFCHNFAFPYVNSRRKGFVFMVNGFGMKLKFVMVPINNRDGRKCKS